MAVPSFFDTNVLVHANDKVTPAKQKVALELIGDHRRNRTGVLSLQISQGYFLHNSQVGC